MRIKIGYKIYSILFGSNQITSIKYMVQLKKTYEYYRTHICILLGHMSDKSFTVNTIPDMPTQSRKRSSSPSPTMDFNPFLRVPNQAPSSKKSKPVSGYTLVEPLSNLSLSASPPISIPAFLPDPVVVPPISTPTSSLSTETSRGVVRAKKEDPAWLAKKAAEKATRQASRRKYNSYDSRVDRQWERLRVQHPEEYVHQREMDLRGYLFNEDRFNAEFFLSPAEEPYDSGRGDSDSDDDDPHPDFDIQRTVVDPITGVKTISIVRRKR
jgi:hypothetical protein